MKDTAYSVLMSVYYKESADFLRAAIDSMLTQSLPPHEFILVCDGRLTPELDTAVAEYETAVPYMKVIRLPENGGLSQALNVGLAHCTCRYVARMDSDDIALPERMALQMEAMLTHRPTFCSGTVLEFHTNPAIVTGKRQLPQTHEEILKFARRRNPINHPAVLFDREAVQSAGGYGECRLFEDYELWLKLLSRGSRGYNLPDPLLKMRTGNGLYDRRGGRGYFRCIRHFERFKRSLGFTTIPEYWFSLLIRGIVCFMPAKLRAFVYKKLLRKPIT